MEAERKGRQQSAVARIDRLSIDEKELLHQLSVIGRQFPVNLVKEVVFLPET